MPVRIYRDKQIRLEPLRGKICGVIGFGSQGHAHALNLRDSGFEVVVGLHRGSKSRPGGASAQTCGSGNIGGGSAKRHRFSRAAGHKDAEDFRETNRAVFTAWTNASLRSRVHRGLPDCHPSAQCGCGNGGTERIRANGAARV